MFSVFLAHAPADAQIARQLRIFLETGCDAVHLASDDAIRPGQDLISAAELGHSADILVLLLSPESNPPRWPRERWEPLLLHTASEDNTRIAILLLEECAFPPLLRRKLKFFDATRERLPAMRQLKRWLLGIQSGNYPQMAFSSDLEILYRVLADEPGIFTASGTMADRFSREAAPDFEAVLWIPASGRTLTQIAGEIGFRLHMTLDGPTEDNCRRIREMLSRKRCLLILDAPDVSQATLDPLIPPGRTSVLFTSERYTSRTMTRASREQGAAWFPASRFAEAYEVLYQLLNSGVEPESCARELVWICEHWDRQDEANALRCHFRPAPSEQLRLF